MYRNLHFWVIIIVSKDARKTLSLIPRKNILAVRKRSTKILGATCATLLVVLTGLFITASQIQPTIQEGTYIGNVQVGGLSIDSAQREVRIWWEGERRTPLQIEWKGHSQVFPRFTPTSLGVTVDDVASVKQAPLNSLEAMITGVFKRKSAKKVTFPILFKPVAVNLTSVIASLNKVLPPARDATVHFVKGQGLYKKPEIPALTVDKDRLYAAVTSALTQDQPVELPVAMGHTRISQKDLDQITTLISSFTTHFPSYQSNRDTNIRLASGKLNGVVLMPGQNFSFNGTVGERTSEGGFKTAPVYKNGGHGVDIGGGICQVSTTLYNASLLGNLTIVSHQNHSMPVAYVPIGRDATVDWGEIDLKLRNDYSFPIVITSSYQPGSLTFRIFGQAQSGMEVKIERNDIHTIRYDTEYQNSSSLKPGHSVVVTDGKNGHRVKTYRLVYLNGRLIKRQYMGESYYHPTTELISRSVAAPTVAPSSVPVLHH